MSSTAKMRGRAGGVYVQVSSLVILLFVTMSVAAAEVLFPAPLHITREVSAPFSQQKNVIDEYCHGNRVVSISGRRTAIADYAKRQVTLIDFAAGTYSVTKFEEIAKVQERSTPHIATDASRQQDWRVEQRGGHVVASRPGERIEIARQNDSGRQMMRLTADRQLKLSRAAAEALLGTGYPYPNTDFSEVLLGALRSNADEYFLPLEYDVVLEVEGEKVETRNVVLRIGNELPPPDLVAVPPGATLVESDPVAARRNLEALDRPTRPTN